MQVEISLALCKIEDTITAMEYGRRIPRRLSRARVTMHRHGVTMAAMATAIGVAESTVSRWLSGKTVRVHRLYLRAIEAELERIKSAAKARTEAG